MTPSAADVVRQAMAATAEGYVDVMPVFVAQLCEQAADPDQDTRDVAAVAREAMPPGQPHRKMSVPRAILDRLLAKAAPQVTAPALPDLTAAPPATAA